MKHDQFHRQLILRLVVGTLLLVTVVWTGRYLGHRIPEVETWIASLGWWAPLVFVILLIAFTSLFVPDTIFAIIAGAVFGMVEGSILMSIGAIATASLSFWISRKLFREAVRTSLDKHPRLSAIEQAVNREGLRLLVLLRLTPIHSVSLSYAVGASSVRFWTFFISCFAMIPLLIVEVYFGYVAVHLAKTAGNAHKVSTLHTVLTVAGFVVCVAVMLYITSIAMRAIDKLTKEVNQQEQAHVHAASDK
ncbi:MAG: TVP38/TMEM64 family protein [Pirellulales bacterium]|nr:TVP38/TMEM64 family protein [Pirellulales bacterium]